MATIITYIEESGFYIDKMIVDLINAIVDNDEHKIRIITNFISKKGYLNQPITCKQSQDQKYPLQILLYSASTCENLEVVKQIIETFVARHVDCSYLFESPILLNTI